MPLDQISSRYQERYILFLDILGFKSLVSRIEKGNKLDLEKLEVITKFLQSMNEEQAIANAQQDLASDKATYSIFSDSVVISVAATKGGMISLLARVMGIPMRWMREGIFVRGAITKGRLLHTPEFLVGSAMIKAYDMESTLAQYPRIVIDKIVFNEAQKMLPPEMQDWLNSTIFMDADGLLALEPFHPYYASGVLGGETGSGAVFAEEHLRKVRDEIQNALTEHVNNDRIRVKYHWLARRLNEVQERWRKQNVIANTFPVNLSIGRQKNSESNG